MIERDSGAPDQPAEYILTDVIRPEQEAAGCGRLSGERIAGLEFWEAGRQALVLKLADHNCGDLAILHRLQGVLQREITLNPRPEP